MADERARLRRPRVRQASSDMVEAARRLCTRMTPAECVVWQAIRDNRLAGLKFRRQYPVGTFVLDFVCLDERLVVEVDGDVHDDPDQQLRDVARDEYLQAAGYRVMRVRNEDVVTDMRPVLLAILSECGVDG